MDSKSHLCRHTCYTMPRRYAGVLVRPPLLKFDAGSDAHTPSELKMNKFLVCETRNILGPWPVPFALETTTQRITGVGSGLPCDSVLSITATAKCTRYGPSDPTGPVRCFLSWVFSIRPKGLLISTHNLKPQQVSGTKMYHTNYEKLFSRRHKRNHEDTNRNRRHKKRFPFTF